MHQVPDKLYYTQTHEWLSPEGDETFRVGITDHAQALLGEMVYIELPEIGSQYEAGSEVAVVESVKAASDVYSPIKGEIIAVNERLSQEPELVNSDPYGEGWLFLIKASGSDLLKALLDAKTYQNTTSE